MDLLLKTVRASYITEEPWFRENTAGSKKPGYRLKPFAVLRERQLSMGTSGERYIFEETGKKKSHLALSGMDESEFWGVFKLT